MVNEEIINKLKQEYLYEILAAKDVRASSALYAYARYLNDLPLEYKYLPLYLKVIEANNRYAVDALIEGYEPESYFNFIAVPNHFVVQSLFDTLDRHATNTLYSASVRVICGLLKRLYWNVTDGFRLYPPSIRDINNLGKHLDETEDQDHPANRIVLDILQFMSELDRLHETNKAKLDIGRQSNKIRANFLDNRRKLVQSITAAILVRADEVDLGTVPEQLQ